jgi:hypothetical protein
MKNCFNEITGLRPTAVKVRKSIVQLGPGLPYQMFLFWVGLIQRQKLVGIQDVNLTAVGYDPIDYCTALGFSR